MDVKLSFFFHGMRENSGWDWRPFFAILTPRPSETFHPSFFFFREKKWRTSISLQTFAFPSSLSLRMHKARNGGKRERWQFQIAPFTGKELKLARRKNRRAEYFSFRVFAYLHASSPSFPVKRFE